MPTTRFHLVSFHGSEGEVEDDVTQMTIVFQQADADSFQGAPIRISPGGVSWSYPKFLKVYFDAVERNVYNLTIAQESPPSAGCTMFAGISEDYIQPGPGHLSDICIHDMSEHGLDNPLVIQPDLVIRAGETGYGNQPFIVLQLRVSSSAAMQWNDVGVYVISYDVR